MGKLIIVAAFAGLIYLSYVFDVHSYLSLSYLKENLDLLKLQAEQQPAIFIGSFFAIYVTVTAASLPGAAILTLAGGAIFGLGLGTVVVSFASTLGATLAFLASRYVLQDYVQQKFGDKMTAINQGVEKEGAFYLFSLRLIPIFPFFLINLLMGLTKIRAFTFFWVSQLGMLAGTLAYVNAGQQISQISSLKDILSLQLIISFAILGVLPISAKRFIDILNRNRVYKPFKGRKPKSFDYDMVAIGGGAAGLVTSYIGAAVKAKVAIVEKDKMGGDCLNTGCVPSKALIRSAHLIHDAKNCQKFGIKKMDYDLDFSMVMKRVHEIIKKIEPHDSVERYTSLGVECYTDHATILSPWSVKIGNKVVTTRNITIACGAEPFIPPIPGLDNIDYLCSDNLWSLKECPKSLLVLGGGPIGSELAQTFSRLGSDVTMVEMQDRILAGEDNDVSQAIQGIFTDEGINVLTNHKAVKFLKEENKQALVCETSGKQITIEFDKVLIAAGRKARTKGYGLENLNIELRKNGTIQVNEYLQTKYPNIFACGDVTGPYQFTHTAAHQAWFCAVNGLFGGFKKFKVDYSVIPWATYTDPEVATVGLSENRAKTQGVEYELSRYDLDDLDRAIADGTDHGFIKVLTVPGKDKILGATIVGAQASNLLVEFVAAMKHGFGLNKILGSIHVYPSMGEANKYAAGVWKKANAPETALKYLKKYFDWKRS